MKNSLLKTIKDLSNKHGMDLNWSKINMAVEKELKTPDSEHDIIREVKSQGKGRTRIPGGVWVMGVGQEVKLIVGEYEFI